MSAQYLKNEKELISGFIEMVNSNTKDTGLTATFAKATQDQPYDVIHVSGKDDVTVGRIEVESTIGTTFDSVRNVFHGVIGINFVNDAIMRGLTEKAFDQYGRDLTPIEKIENSAKSAFEDDIDTIKKTYLEGDEFDVDDYVSNLADSVSKGLNIYSEDNAKLLNQVFFRTNAYGTKYDFDEEDISGAGDDWVSETDNTATVFTRRIAEQVIFDETEKMKPEWDKEKKLESSTPEL